MAPRVPAFQRALRTRLPERRQQVQSVIARKPLVARAASGVRNGQARDRRRPLGPGSRPEVALQAEDVRLNGRADLITVSEDGCAITDYKTGAQHDHHV